MKEILVIDKPEYCDDCPILFENYCGKTLMKLELDYDETCNYLRPSWCPLRPLPQKIEVDVKKIEDIMNTEFQMVDVIQDKIKAKIKLDTDKLIALGYNKCIDEILGEWNGK